LKKIIHTVLENSRYLLNLSATFLSQFVSALSVLILTPLLLERLGTEHFGTFGVVLNVVVFSTVFDFGFNIGFLKRLIEKKIEAIVLLNTLFFFFIGMLLVYIPLFYLLYTLGFVKVDSGILFFACITSLLIIQNILALLFDVILQSVNKIFLGRVIRVSKLLLDFFLILLLSKKGSVPLLLMAAAFVNFLYLFTLMIFSRKELFYQFSIKLFNIGILLHHFIYSFWYFLNSIAVVLVFNSQLIMMNMIAGSTSVAKFLMITKFYDIIRIGLTNFTVVLFPTLATIQAEGDWCRIKHMFFNSIKRILILGVFIFLVVWLVGKPFFLKWSKFDDAEMSLLFIIFSVFILFIVIDNVSATFLAALRENKVPTIVSLFQGIIGLLLGYFLLLKMGVAGLALASLIALISTNFWFNPVFLIKQINSKIDLQKEN
jgi:O-antigen/teichoic acid export membrane protein